MLNISKYCGAALIAAVLFNAAALGYYQNAFLGEYLADPTNWTVGANWEPSNTVPPVYDPNIPGPAVDVVNIANNCVMPGPYTAYVQDFTLTANYPGNPELFIPAGPANVDITMRIKPGVFIRSDYNFYVSQFGTGNTTDAKSILYIERGATVSVGWMFYTRTAGIGIVYLNGKVIAEALQDPTRQASIDINARTLIDFDWSGKMVLRGDHRAQFANASSWVQEGLITDRGVKYGQTGWGTTNGLKAVYDGNWTTITSVAYTPDPCAAQNPQPADGYDNVYPGQTLSWGAPVLGPASVSYKLYLSTNHNLNVTPVSLTGTSYTPANLFKGNTYYWRIDIVNASTGLTVHTGPVWSFTLPMMAKPELIAPVSDANVIAGTVNLQWRFDSTASTNTLAIRQPTDANWTESTVTGTSYHPAGLALGKTYQWKIKSVFPDTTVLESSTWTFKTLNPVCNGGQRLPGDENGDCKVNMLDLAVKASRWLK